MRELIRKLAQKPKTIFLIDSLGALATALILFTVLRTFSDYFGMPPTTLLYLSIIAMIFSLYSITCYSFVKKDWQPYLKAIMIANCLYCCLTIGLMVYHYQSITLLGIAYFVSEITIIGLLVFIELKTLGQWKKNP